MDNDEELEPPDDAGPRMRVIRRDAPRKYQYPTEKRCRRCKEMKPIERFLTRRHKMCEDCAISIISHDHGLNATHGLTTSKEGMRIYNRMKYRADKMPEGPPPPGMILSERKLCRQCQKIKPRSEFGSWRIRICLACDGPTIEELRQGAPFHHRLTDKRR